MTAPSIQLVTSSSRQLITRQSSIQNAEFLILFWRVNCTISVLGLFLIKNFKIAIQRRRVIIIPRTQGPKIKEKFKEVAY
jgi:hypothetical protein